MWLVVVGVLMLLLKLVAIGPVAHWSWWVVLAPFAVAAVWWQFADSVGITQRAAAERQDRRVARRREERLDALGLRPGKSGSGAARAGRDGVAPPSGVGPVSPKPPEDEPGRQRRQ